MNEETPALTPKKLVLVIVLLVAVAGGILFQMFWNPDKATVQADIEIQKQAFLQNLVEPQVGTLFSLDPANAVQGDAGFHGFQIQGEFKLSPEDVAAVALEFKDAADSYTEDMGIPDCFAPKFGIRVVKDGKTSDFLLSHECKALKAFAPGADYTYGAAGSPTKLDEIVKAAHSPPPDPQESPQPQE